VYTFTENEKVKILSFPKETYFYYITLDKDTNSQEIEKIIEIVKNLQ
jgi:hypothetical protein